jgi:hypothetical protein
VTSIALPLRRHQQHLFMGINMSTVHILSDRLLAPALLRALGNKASTRCRLVCMPGNKASSKCRLVCMRKVLMGTSCTCQGCTATRQADTEGVGHPPSTSVMLHADGCLEIGCLR